MSNIQKHFSVGLLPSDGLRYSVNYESEQHLNAHENVIRPLVENAKEIFVYGLKEGSTLLKRHKGILTKHQGKYSLTLNQEVSSDSQSAVKYCKEQSKKGLFSVLFPASNGIDWMTIFGPEDVLSTLYENAIQKCNELDFWAKQAGCFQNGNQTVDLANGHDSSRIGG
ncbi:hypothetical protein [Paenibacillus prosopidis]|uniref:Uncharacterized protein n=1 Tax=Paenibacillus prosopidis TaxID=630520 RepID=A0A368W4X0_9BACL|nr:hypothetical protein [Paenibacillus prosopidis]RCW48608.1 hypothetical protein DFP97_106312 [Paenibacillus prosopidis]